MSDIAKRAQFYPARKRKAKIFHIETEGAVVNITVGLQDRHGRAVMRVDVVPDDERRGGDGQGRIWVAVPDDGGVGGRLVRLHRGCRCRPPAEPVARTCRQCGQWCDRCEPAPEGGCPSDCPTT